MQSTVISVCSLFSVRSSKWSHSLSKSRPWHAKGEELSSVHGKNKSSWEAVANVGSEFSRGRSHQRLLHLPETIFKLSFKLSSVSSSFSSVMESLNVSGVRPKMLLTHLNSFLCLRYSSLSSPSSERASLLQSLCSGLIYIPLFLERHLGASCQEEAERS